MAGQETACPQRETLPRFVSRLPTRALLALDLIRRLDTQPLLTASRNKSGNCESRLRYRSGGKWLWLCLGNLEAEHEQMLARAIKARWPVNGRELNRTIRTLTRLRSASRERAKTLAAACGYRFRGLMIHRIGGKE